MLKKSYLIIFIILILMVSSGLIYVLLNGNNSNDITTDNITEEILTEETTISTDTLEETTSTEILTTEETTTDNTTTNKTSTSKKTTTKKSKTTTTTKKIVNTYKEEVETIVEEKYGSKLVRTDTVTYTVYEDGTNTSKTKNGKTKIDNSNFNGTYATMKSDASSIYSSNIDKINGVLNHVNEYRTEVGVASITLDKDLSIAATVRAMEMGWNNYFDHTRPDGRSCFTILSEAGISYWTTGENIAKGQTTADSVSNDWKNSSGHYANMIDGNFTKIGIGYAKVNGTTYWVQLFVG